MFKVLSVLLASIHYFRAVNVGRHDATSWGAPELDLPPEFGVTGADGVFVPSLWDTTKGGVIAAHALSEVKIPGVTVEAAIAERRARYTELSVSNTGAAAVYKALYYGPDGEPIAPEYMGCTGFRRNWAMPYIVKQWLDHDRTHNVSDVAIPIEVRPFVSELQTLAITLGENNQRARLPYSDVGRVHIVSRLVSEGYRESVACDTAGFTKGERGKAQKAYAFARLCLAPCGAGLAERIALEPSTVKKVEGEKTTDVLTYVEGGYVPYSKATWQDCRTLLGDRITDAKSVKLGQFYTPALAPADGKCATVQEVEQWAKGLFSGNVKSTDIGRQDIDSLALLFRPLPDVTAPVVAVLTAIIHNRRDYFAALAKGIDPPTLDTPAAPVSPGMPKRKK